MSKVKNGMKASSQAKGEVRDRVLREAVRLFAENGYTGTSVQHIVEAAGTTKPMLYYYFGDKEGLYKELITEFYRSVRSNLEQIDAEVGNLKKQLVAVVEANFSVFKQSPDLAWFGFSTLFFRPKDSPNVGVNELGEVNFGLVQDIVGRGIEQGEIEGDRAEIALALSGLIVIYVMAQALRPDRYSAKLLSAASADRLVHLLLKGVEPRDR